MSDETFSALLELSVPREDVPMVLAALGRAYAKVAMDLLTPERLAEAQKCADYLMQHPEYIEERRRRLAVLSMPVAMYNEAHRAMVIAGYTIMLVQVGAIDPARISPDVVKSVTQLGDVINAAYTVSPNAPGPKGKQ